MPERENVNFIKIIHDPERPSYKNILNWIFFIEVLILIGFNFFSFVWPVINAKVDTILAVNALVLTLIALVITIIIAFNQHFQLTSLQSIGEQTKETTTNQLEQLARLQKIGEQTQETTEALRTETKIREAVENFFKISEKHGKKFQLIYPEEYDNKPLPMINQGDFYAIHVVSTRLGEENLLNTPLPLLSGAGGKTGENLIFICSPYANPALKHLYEINTVFRITKDKVQVKGEDENFPKVPKGLPCWFVSEEVANKSRPVRRIWVEDDGKLIDSPVEDLYEEAFTQRKKFRHPAKAQDDYGIFGRWHENNCQYIVIAGIHQYGTWIIAYLLSELCYGRSVRGKDIFLGKQDFIAIIEGVFDYTTLKVKRADILTGYIWTKNGENWDRVKEIK
jgi:hypothetical protein